MWHQKNTDVWTAGESNANCSETKNYILKEDFQSSKMFDYMKGLSVHKDLAIKGEKQSNLSSKFDCPRHLYSEQGVLNCLRHFYKASEVF